MIHIKKLIERSINRLGIKKETELYQVSYFFNEVINELFDKKKKTQFEVPFLRNKIAFIKIKNPSEASVFYLRRNEILEKLNKKLENNSIEDLRFIS